MNPTRIRPLQLIALVLVVALVACGGEQKAERSIPKIDTSGMEPQVAERIESARAMVATQPDSADAWGRLGMVCQAHALYEPAVGIYRISAEMAPADSRWPYLEALATLKFDPEGALGPFERAATLAPTEPSFWIAYGDALSELGEQDRAVAQYEYALELDPGSSHALFGLARVAASRAEIDQALAHLERAVRLAPEHGQAQALLAQLAFRTGDQERAERAQLMASSYPDPTRAFDPVVVAMEDEAVSSRAFTQRGLQLAEESRFSEAEAVFRQVLEIRPGNARDYSNLGGALARQGKTDEAIANYQRALELEAGDPATLNNLAMAYADQGALAAAATRLEEAIAADPGYVEALHNLGLVHARQGRQDEAIAAYRRALDVNSSFVDARVSLGTALAASRRIPEAIEQWRQAVQLDRRNLPALYNLSAALIQRGEHGEAIEHLRTGLSYAPDSSRFASLLAWELSTAPQDELRNGEEAVALARRIHEAYPSDPSSADVLGAALAETGEFAEAERLVTVALELARRAGAPTTAQIELRLKAYRSGLPFRQPVSGRLARDVVQGDGS